MRKMVLKSLLFLFDIYVKVVNLIFIHNDIEEADLFYLI